MRLRFAFLVLKEHPYGREMLRILLERGHMPGLIIEEDSAVADEERGKFLTRIAGQPVPPAIAELVAGLDIPCRAVHNHNSLGCLETLRDHGPDLVVLGGTRIIRPPVLEVPSLGTINAHPGLLPQLRGSSSVGWALYKDLPVGSTVHYVDAGIDTGPILLRRQLLVYRGERYEQIVRRVLTLSGELMAEALTLIECGAAQPRPQDPAEGEALRVIPPHLLAEAKNRLAAGLYNHFADREVRDDADEPSRS
ncbi:MAG: formyltransferase family protein [Anaerolineae bacterium]|jgi:methionyl-tRNA formyltransferase